MSIISEVTRMGGPLINNQNGKVEKIDLILYHYASIYFCGVLDILI